MTTLGERIRILRGESSQQEFADKLSISRQYVALLESGRREPSPVLMDSLCQKFQIRREWLETGAEPQYPEQVQSGPETIIPELFSILSNCPAVLEMFQKVVHNMRPSDWQRLNQLLDESVQTQKDTEA